MTSLQTPLRELLGVRHPVLLAAVAGGPSTPELPADHREAIACCPADGTLVTDAVTGRPARWIRNRLVDALVAAGAGSLGWGQQLELVADMRSAAARLGRFDLLPMLAGQRAALVGPPRPAAKIAAELAERTQAAVGAEASSR